MNLMQLLPMMSALGLQVPSVSVMLGLVPLLSRKRDEVSDTDLEKVGAAFGVKIPPDIKSGIIATMQTNAFDTLADLLGSDAHFIPLMMKVLKKDQPEVEVVCRFCKTSAFVGSALFLRPGSTEVECERCGEVRIMDNQAVTGVLNSQGERNVEESNDRQ